MLRRFWYRQFYACFGLWLCGVVLIALLPTEKWVAMIVIFGGLSVSVISMILCLWMVRCPHCKWRLFPALSRGLYDPDGVFICPRCGKPIRLV